MFISSGCILELIWIHSLLFKKKIYEKNESFMNKLRKKGKKIWSTIHCPNKNWRMNEILNTEGEKTPLEMYFKMPLNKLINIFQMKTMFTKLTYYLGSKKYALSLNPKHFPGTFWPQQYQLLTQQSMWFPDSAFAHDAAAPLPTGRTPMCSSYSSSDVLSRGKCSPHQPPAHHLSPIEKTIFQ